ncbi:MAG: D-alanyl-D-alanine carboxypeptidase family protein [Chthoniobacterales bacterium]
MKDLKTFHSLALFLTAALFLNGCATQPASTPQPEVRNAQPVSHVATPPTGDPTLWPAQAPVIRAQSAIMIDANTGQTIYQKNADAPRPVASTQKLLTALIVSRDSMEQAVVIDRDDTSVEPTKLFMKPGSTYSRRQLLTAMLVHSCNDAAHALARSHSGSISVFADEMNRYASAYGATNSHFVNPNGLPAVQHSTARDMARIAFHAYHNSLLRQIMAMPSFTFVYSSKRATTFSSTNKLLSHSTMFNGMKTGFTDASGKCLIASANYGGRDVILVQLGSKSRYIFDDADRMIKWGLSRGSFFSNALAGQERSQSVSLVEQS